MQACDHYRRSGVVRRLSETREGPLSRPQKLSREWEISTLIGRQHPARNLDGFGQKMLVRDLMEREVVSLEASDSLDLADDIMRLGRIRHMPVLSGGRVVGIVSQRDLFRAGVSSVLQLRRESEREWLAKIPVQGIMTTTVLTIHPDRSVREAVQIMIDKKVGCLPVVDSAKLVGLLSESDCLRYLARLLDISEAKSDLPELPPAT